MIIDEYLVKLGAVVDQSGMNHFHNALRDAARITEANMTSIARSVVKAQTEVVSGLAAIGAAAIGLADKVAMADQEYRLFALHMFMSKDAARGLKVAMDALGQPLENLAWDPELRARTTQLLADQRAMSPGGDYDEQMKKIRDIRFEFTRMEVEVQYIGMHVVTEFMKALGVGPDELLARLREFNALVITHIPEITAWLKKNLMPILVDVKNIFFDIVHILQDFATLFDNIVATLSGDATLTGVANFDKFGRSVENVVHWLALAVHFLNQFGFTITGMALGAAFGPIGAAAGGLTGDILDMMRRNDVGPWKGGHYAADDANLNQLIKDTVPTPSASSSLVNAVISQESGGKQSAVSPKGAIGLMQLMPGTAQQYGVNPYDAAQNVAGGTAYLNDLLKRYGGNTAETLGAYNAGPGRMDKFLAGKATLPSETQDYIARVLGRMGASGSVQVGALTINIHQQPGEHGEDLARRVVRIIKQQNDKQTQFNLSEFQGQSWAYPGV